MAEYIEREALLREIERRESLMVGDKLVSVDAMKYFIKNRPAADVAPVRHGRWLHRKNGVAYCSECEVDTVEDETNYCPSCGAKMELED